MSAYPGKIVVVTVRVKSNNGRYWRPNAPPPLKSVDKHNHRRANSKSEIQDALKDLKDGDILVFNAHANEQYFIYGKERAKVHWQRQSTDIPGFWEYFDLDKKPPKLAAVIMASCMRPLGEKLERNKLKALRNAFNTQLIVAPFSTYNYKIGLFGQKDNRVADMMLGQILN